MSITIKYAYLKQQTWLYRRAYPKDVAACLGSTALKKSLKTSDPTVARKRVRELDAKFEELVEKIRAGGKVDCSRLTPIQVAPVHFQGGSPFMGTTLVSALASPYLNRRSDELKWGGFKSIRYSMGLFVSKWGDRAVGSLTREDGKVFLADIARLSAVIGKSEHSRGLGLDALVAFSRGRKDHITVRTQKRIFRQTNHFLDWCVYEGQLESNPFQTVQLVGKVRPAPYAVPTDAEVLKLLTATGERIHRVLLFCLLSGMRSGEAAGLLREDLVPKGNLGTFAHVRPNVVRDLKTENAERLVPLHPRLQDLLPSLSSEGLLFPRVSVAIITKDFASLRKRLGLTRPGLVFHSSRKWFVTQCERAGVPEHYTASLVGHASARSENGLTYSIYSAGISDEQKRGIVDSIRLPE